MRGLRASKYSSIYFGRLMLATLLTLSPLAMDPSHRLCQAQETDSKTPAYPDTPAGAKLRQLLECVNEPNAKARLAFLTSGFADPDEVEQREAVSARLHERFAPLSLLEVIQSEEKRIVVHCGTSRDIVLMLDMTLSETAGNPIAEIGMEPLESDSQVELPDGMLPLINEDGSTAEELRGVWLADGYGYVMQVLKDEVKVFSMTKSFFWPQEFDEDIYYRMPDDNAPSLATKQMQFTFHPLEPGYRMLRLDRLPTDREMPTKWTPSKRFDLFVEVFDAHYPFFETRNLDWDARVQAVRPTIKDEMSERELFEAVSKLIADLDDGHVSLTASIDGEDERALTGGEGTLSRLRASFQPSEETKTYGKYFRAWRDRMVSGINNELLNGAGKIVANDQIIWGRVHERVGYIAINGMGGYSYGAIDAQVAELHRVLNEVLSELSDTDALIVDIAFNGGGSDLYSMEIASHFTEERRLGFSKWPRDRKQYRLDRYVTPIRELDASAASYTKPIYLVTSDITASAAEIFTMCMRAMPQVTTVGMSTEGALSDVLFKSLPGEWELGLSNEIYVDHEGVCHEGPGVPPQIPIDVYDKDDITKIGHVEAIKKV
ncbi:MAG: S41 family peptidase, partial [Pirellulaceae bacterium]